MKHIELPDSIAELVESLQLVQVNWHGQQFQVPKFAIYAILHRPVYEKFFSRKGRRLALLRLGRYQVPVLSPCLQPIDETSPHVLVLSHCRENRFGLYAFAVDEIECEVCLPAMHPLVDKLVKDFV